MNAALLGMGTIGSGVFEQAAGRSDIRITKVLDKREIPGIQDILTRDFDSIVADSGVDTVIELMGGEEPAYSFARRILTSGKNLVSANKLMLSHHLPELLKLASENGVQLRFSAAAGGGIPFLHNLMRLARADRIEGITGIVNGTCNYILDAIENGNISIDAALSTAQACGYAEKDPTSDIDGFDSAYKLAIATSIACGRYVDPARVYRSGIRCLSEEDSRYFATVGKKLRLLAESGIDGEKVWCRVVPVLLSSDSLFAAVHTNGNLIGIRSRYSGCMTFSGQGAGKDPTACAVIGDLIDIASGLPCTCRVSASPAEMTPDKRNRYYIRCAERPEWAEKRVGQESYETLPVLDEEVFGFAEKMRAAGRDVFMAKYE